ncbi:hypothetical protein MIMGU_mgv1a005393mg [Erythranthe guttata]|uniref:Uncharacterized protein n=2 Tax=Erythranthe guttata TaxID=4155 RepID=A0A022QVQ9_ERYGU|nr:hypothetical protein MIMGU_mgv1a005393mg [Erythranthe guttata]
MTKNYDNWYRLVTAVVRRERDRQIALSHSRDDISIGGSSSSSSSFDLSNNNLNSTSQILDPNHHSLVLQETIDHLQYMEYSDLALDHNEWKAMLPPGKHLWSSSSLSFFLDKGGEKNCFLVGSKNLTMSSGDKYGSENCWENIYKPKSRYSEVAELRDSRHLYIECVIKTRMLSPHTLYAAYLVFGFTENHAKLHSAVSIIRNFCDETGLTYPEEQVRIVHFERGGGRKEDWWMEIELGDFYVGPGENGERGLIVEGVEFRPLTPREIRRQLPMDYSDLTLDHTVWKTMLPPDKREVVWRSACLSFFLDEGTGKNCFFLGAANILMSSRHDGDDLVIETKSHPKSRFTEVVELKASKTIDIQGRIKTRMLSPKTIYTAYLVFGFIVKDEGKLSANSIIRSFRGGGIDYDLMLKARLVGDGRMVDFDQEGCDDSRGDDWMEVALGKFYVSVGDDEEVVVQVLNLSDSGTSGVVVEGIEFRPMREKG